MSNEDDWVADVRRWYFGGTEPAGERLGGLTPASSSYEAALGYEAAHPALQSRHWPDAPRFESESDDASGANRCAH